MQACTVLRLQCLLLLSAVLMAGCSRRPAINGEFRIDFVWAKGRLKSAIVEAVKPQERVSQATRKAITETAQPFITDALRAADLTQATGRIQIAIYGSPPYFVQLRELSITEPDFSKLALAVEQEDTESIRSIIGKYDNVNQRGLPSRQTALAVAAAGGRVRSLRTLLELGADPNRSDYIGVTPLMNAVVIGSEDAVTTLLLAGANTTTVNGAGDSAPSLAKKLHRKKILGLLETARQ